MQIVYRACRHSDLIVGAWSLFNYGLANHRGTNVNATFSDTGYHTHGISSTADPLVAFTYACMQSTGTHDIVIFAILISDDVANAGRVQRQASEKKIAPHSVTGKSVAAQREIVLSKVRQSDLLGYYSIRMRSTFFDLGKWTPIRGDASLQTASQRILKQAVMGFARRCGGVVSRQMCERELDRLMGH